MRDLGRINFHMQKLKTNLSTGAQRVLTSVKDALPLAERANSYWVTLESKAPQESNTLHESKAPALGNPLADLALPVPDSLEGKLHFPDAAVDNGKIYIFGPGFPGRGSADLERLHLEKLTAAGFTVLAPRHNGSLLTGKFSDFYISCPERQALAREIGQHALGSEPSCNQGSEPDNEPGAKPDQSFTALDRWLLEPFVAYQALAPHFNSVVMLGHSFGGLALMYSTIALFKTGEINRMFEGKKHNLRRIISMAGATGIIRGQAINRLSTDKDASHGIVSENQVSEDGIIKMWQGYVDSPFIQERVSIGPKEDNLRHLEHGYRTIHADAKAIDPDVDFICLHPWGDEPGTFDELISIKQPLELLLSMGRGALIVDKTQKADAAKEQLAHDMCDLDTGFLLKLLDTDWQPPSQISQLTATGLI